MAARRWVRQPGGAPPSPPPSPPLVGGCPRHRGRQTCLVLKGGLHCLTCSGCPRGHRLLLVTDDDGDWLCGLCGEMLCAWSTWRREVRVWRGVRQARREGYRRGVDSP